jgi:uncharacterized repeat protein (TIGR01451 family)
MAATKTVDAITDGAGGSFAIPGAIVTYKIVIGNTGSATASGITIIDEIPDNTSFYVTSGPTGGSAYAYTTDATVDGNSTWNYSPTADGNGVDTTVTGIKLTTADIAASGSATVTFKVKID